MKTNSSSALPIVLMALSFMIGLGLVACMKVGDGVGVDEYGAPLIVVPDPCVVAPTSKGCPQDPCVLNPLAAECVVDSCTLAQKPASCPVIDSCALIPKPAGCPLPGPSFATDVMPILTANCLECHKKNGTAESTKLLFTPESAYVNLINVRSTGTKTSNLIRVVPGKADSSFLYMKISMATPPGDGVRMPQNKAPLKADKIEIFKNWINAGALP